MLSYLWNRLINIQNTLSYFIYHALDFLSHIIPHFLKNGPSTPQKSHDVESNIPSHVDSDPSVCETYTVRLQPQRDLDIVGVGASGQVYNVDDQIVLKLVEFSSRLAVMPLKATIGIMLQTHCFTLVC